MNISPHRLVNGIPTYAHQEGQGPTLVMLHGMASSSDCWQYAVEALRADYHVIVPDLPGHGRSGGKARPYSLRYYVDWLDHLLADLGAKGPFILMGNSMGGAVSLAYTLAHPRDVQKLVLVDPLGLSASLSWSALGHGILSAPGVLMAMLTRKIDPFLMRAMRPWIFSDPWGPSYESILRTAALNFEQGFWSLGAGLRVVFSDFFSPRQRREFINKLTTLTLPVLVIWGRHDGVLPYKRAAAGLSRMPQAVVRIFEQSSHTAMLEQPQEFNAAVSEFLKG